MHYVHCIFCDYTYSADGNPHYVTDSGEMLCESCIYDTVEVDKEKINDTIVYTVSNDWVSEHHEEVCEDIEKELLQKDIQYTRHSSKTESIDRFIITEEEVLVKTLAGVRLQEIFYL
jgi:hypothetical protein